LPRRVEIRPVSERTPQRIPSLDGLRALSIGLVVVGHLVPCLRLGWSEHVLAALDLGRLGVRVFFVISGFLITRLLLEERARTGTISLPQFYLRRTLRIFPPYYAFLLTLLVLHHAGLVVVPPEDFRHAATYTTNYFATSWTLGHTWSLSVEEQFYLLWPALFLLLGSRRWMAGVAVILVAAPIDRLLQPAEAVQFGVVADALAAGCLLAGLHDRLAAIRPAPRLLRASWTFVVSLAGALAIELVATRPSVVPTWVHRGALVSAQNGLIALAIHWSIVNAGSAIGRLLNSRPLRFVGVISYSIYLWQQPFMNSYAPAAFTTFPLNLVGAGACALASYYAIERPALSFRRRLERRAALARTPQPATGRELPGLTPGS